MNKNLFPKTISKIKILSGIYGERVFQGPYQIYINPTDYCNLNCLMCSVYSPLIEDKGKKDDKGFLQKETLDRLAHSLARLKVPLVTITGGGEPFLHPYLMDFVRILSDHRKDVTIVTNGTLVKEAQITELIQRNVNLRFSLIAASPGTYVEVHPNQTPAAFEKLNNNLALIRDLRMRSKSLSVISILFVIFKNNFEEIPKMLEMGKDYQADFVHFKPAIFDHEEMRELFLNENELRKLSDVIRSAESSYDISHTDLTNIRGDLERNMRRVLSRDQSSPKRSVPCYKGWTFSWVLANGDVLPCCDCNVSLGNINRESLEDVWHSEAYSKLRKKMTTLNRGVLDLPGCRCDACRPEPEELKVSKGLSLLGRILRQN